MFHVIINQESDDETSIRFKRSKKNAGTCKKDYFKVADEQIDEDVPNYVSKKVVKKDEELIDISLSDEQHLDDFIDGKTWFDESTCELDNLV